MSEEYRFRASDAFAYVDTYRRQILNPAPRIQDDLARVRDQSQGKNLSPSRTFAELRALEHALAYVVKREEPGLVVLGDFKEGDETGPAAAALKKSQEELRRCDEHVETLENTLKQNKLREQALQEEILLREQQIARIKHRMEHMQSSVTVLSAALAATVLVLVLVLLI